MDKLKWVLTLFEGEKTILFWLGLLLMSFSSIVLFSVVWYTAMYNPTWFGSALISTVPIMAGAIVFILIGFYMMKEGVKKKKATPRIVPLNAA